MHTSNQPTQWRIVLMCSMAPVEPQHGMPVSSSVLDDLPVMTCLQGTYEGEISDDAATAAQQLGFTYLSSYGEAISRFAAMGYCDFSFQLQIGVGDLWLPGVYLTPALPKDGVRDGTRLAELVG